MLGSDEGTARQVPTSLETQGRKHHVQGDVYARAGQWKQALRQFEKAVRYAPHLANFNYTHGIALARLGQLDQAIEAYRREIAIMPGHAFALAELGICLAQLGRTRDSITYLQQALHGNPRMPVAQFSLGVALLTENRSKEAISAFNRVLGLHGAYGDIYRLRGLAYAMEGDDEKSAEDLGAAAALDSKSYQAVLSLGLQLGNKERDLQAGLLFEMAAKLAPKIALPHYIFGQFLLLNRRFERGLEHIERAIKLEPGQAKFHFAKGFGLLGQGRVEEALASYRHAVKLDPDNTTMVGDMLFVLQHKPGITRAELLQAHKRWAVLIRPQAPKPRLAFANDPNPGRKPRIGLVSADLHRHAVSHLTLRALERLAALGYEIFCYKTDRRRPDDAFSERYKAFAKSWRDVSGLDDAALAALIAEQGIDILFDLAGHTSGNRLLLFAARAAPIQLSWAGYVGTVGLDTYDGLIADPIEVPPEHDDTYVEPVIRLPDCYVCYHPPLHSPDVGELPFLKTGTFTFGCFNRPAKLNIEVARAWWRILKQVPQARILMVYGGLNEKSTQEAVYRILQSGGVPRDRVDLVGETEQSKLLQAYAEKVDLALDPFPYSGGVTTLEAMWMGVPAVTLVGETFAGRHSATHLSAAGLAEFCTNSVDAYVDLAIEWTRRPQQLAALRAGLRDKVAGSPLNDEVRFGDHLDTALTRLWTEWCMLRRAQPETV
jgi:protein O-GlcNAc transferase